MANSRSLLVYVLALALVVCGRSWVSANTVPIVVRDHLPVSSGGPSSPQSQHQPHQQPKYYQASQQLPQQRVHTSPEKLPAPVPSSSAPPAPAPTPTLPPKSLYPQQQYNAPKSFSLKNAWGLSAGNSDSGPYTSGYGYWGVGTGRAVDPSTSYMTDVDLPEHAQTRPANTQETFNNLQNPQMNLDSLGTLTSAISPLGTSTMEGAQTLFTALLGVFAGYLGGTGRLSRVMPVIRSYFYGEEEPEVKNSTVLNARHKRDVDVQDYNVDLTELTTIVLSAIQSGECMQRSICLIGSRIGNSNKGRAAFTLVDKLIPESVQTNQYFVTMKKALKGGETFCDRFRCRFN